MLQSIQAMRAVAALFVVLSHLQPIEKKYVGYSLLPDWAVLGVSGVDLFFVISGFVMVTVTQKKGGADVVGFLWSRFVRIFPTYWFYFGLILCVYIVAPHWVNAAYGSPPDVLTSFFLIFTPVPLVAVSWSMTHELWFYVVFAGLLFLPQRWRSGGLGVWAAVLIVAHSEYVLLHAFGLEFIFGALLATAFSKGLRVPPWICIAAAGVGLWMASFASPPWSPFVRVAIFGIPYGLLVLGMVGAERDGLRFPSALCRIGDASYSLYLCHVIVMSALGRLMLALGGVPPVLGVVVLLASSIAAAMLSYRYIETPLIEALRRSKPTVRPVEPVGKTSTGIAV
jgi:exopolysaccharide production protein ExoZ